MEQPENFYLDVRIRARALTKGLVSEKDVEGYLGGLPDLDGKYDVLNLEQPAMARVPQISELARPAEIRPAPERITVAEPIRAYQPEPAGVYEAGADEDEEEEEEDEDEEELVSSAAQAPAAPPAPAVAAPPAAAAVEPPSPAVAAPSAPPPATPATAPEPPRPMADREEQPSQLAEASTDSPTSPTVPRPNSVPPSSQAISDGSTEVSDDDWSVPEEPPTGDEP